MTKKEKGVFLSEPIPLTKYKRRPRNVPKTDWLAILKQIPDDTYRAINRKPITTMVAIRRLEKQNLIPKGKYTAHTQKQESGEEITLVWNGKPTQN